MNIIKFLFLVVLVFSLYYFTNKKNKNDKKRIEKFLKNKEYEKKNNVLIFSCGPSLNELSEIKKKFTKEFLDDTHVIAVKNSINKLEQENLKCDFLVTNWAGQNHSIKVNTIKKLDPLILCTIDRNDKKNSEKHINNLDGNCSIHVNINWHENIMKNVEKNIDKALEFKYEDQEDGIKYLATGWGHIMNEMAFPLSVYLKPKNLFILGWDIKDGKKFYEKFSEKSELEQINYTESLKIYLKEKYDINCYKLSNKQAIKFDLYEGPF